jgi:hypothetical protein
MQVMPDTLKDAGYGVTPARDNSIEETTRVGVQYLGAMLKAHNGDLDKSLAAYNAGVGNVRKYGGVPPFDETKKYIGRIKGYMTQQGREGFTAQQQPQLNQPPAQAQAVATPQQMDNGGNTAPVPPVNPIVNNGLPQQLPTNQAPEVANNQAFAELAKKNPDITMENLEFTAQKRGMTVDALIEILRSR